MGTAAGSVTTGRAGGRPKTACCGAGCGRMWVDDGPHERIGTQRVHEALRTGTRTIAVSCPFCLTMMSDGVATQDGNVSVKDVAELLVEAIDRNPEHG